MSEPEKVYLVSQGEYSDYTIIGVFSTQEKAEKAIALRPDWTGYSRDCSIEEMPLDSTEEFLKPGHEVGPIYDVQISIKDGTIKIPESNSIYDNPSIDDRDPNACDISVYAHVDKIEVSSPISFDHATKVAVERRQQWLREEKDKVAAALARLAGIQTENTK